MNSPKTQVDIEHVNALEEYQAAYEMWTNAVGGDFERTRDAQTAWIKSLDKLHHASKTAKAWLMYPGRSEHERMP